MSTRIDYEMNQEQLDKILEACKPTRCMMIGGVLPLSPQENANRVWASLGKVMGFDSLTVEPSEKGNRFFSAVAS